MEVLSNISVHFLKFVDISKALDLPYSFKLNLVTFSKSFVAL